MMTIEEIRTGKEGQTFDLKSIQIDPKALAIPIVAMANADGGMLAIGISDKTRKIEGVNIIISLKLHNIHIAGKFSHFITIYQFLLLNFTPTSSNWLLIEWFAVFYKASIRSAKNIGFCE